MSGLWYTDIDAVLRAAGLTVRDDSYNAGWQSRARSSGGFPATPLCVFWHHTASSTSIANDLAWQCGGCDDSPVGNMTIDRDGVVWPVAAGASNCAGKGGPVTLSRGTIPVDSGNTRGWNVEVANDGVGERWPIAQINSYFVASNALNAYFGNRPDDIISHALGDGDGWTDRKIDPAQAGAVEGPWQPSSCNSSGTWLLADIRAECLARAGAHPEEDEVTQADIDAIVAAVIAQLPAATWGYPLTNQVSHEANAAGTLLEWTHAEAHGANTA